MEKIFSVSSAGFRNKNGILCDIKQAINASFVYIDQESHIIYGKIGTSKTVSFMFPSVSILISEGLNYCSYYNTGSQ